MSTELSTPQKNPIMAMATSVGWQNKLDQALGSRKQAFLTSLASVTSGSDQLLKCTGDSVINSCLVAASMDLPFHPSLGQAAAVPYYDSKKKIFKASFQIQWKGLVQLAYRSAQYETINVTEVYEGELVKKDRFTGIYEFDESKRTSDKVIGYVAYFLTLAGFHKQLFWTVEECMAHAKTYSKSYQYDLRENKKTSTWSTDPDSMCRKTVLKLLIDKWGPKSIEMEKAIIYDQAIVKGDESSDPEIIDADYIDNPNTPIEAEVKDGFVKDEKKAEQARKMTESALNIGKSIAENMGDKERTPEQVNTLKVKLKDAGLTNWEKGCVPLLKEKYPDEDIPEKDHFLLHVKDPFVAAMCMWAAEKKK